MKGAIIGDIAGSAYEWKPVDMAAFSLFGGKCWMTDDTVLTVAVADALLTCRTDGITVEDDILDAIRQNIRRWGRLYPDCGFSRSFRAWLESDDPQPYGSRTNGALMRCSAAGWMTDNPQEARRLGELTALPSHNHPEATAAAGLCAELICRSRGGASKDELYALVSASYPIPRLDDIRPITAFDFTCVTTMPIAFAAFYESTSVEDAVCRAISLSGDTDTNAAIAGALAEAYYGLPDALWQRAKPFCSDEVLSVVARWEQAFPR